MESAIGVGWRWGSAQRNSPIHWALRRNRRHHPGYVPRFGLDDTSRVGGGQVEDATLQIVDPSPDRLQPLMGNLLVELVDPFEESADPREVTSRRSSEVRPSRRCPSRQGQERYPDHRFRASRNRDTARIKNWLRTCFQSQRTGRRRRGSSPRIDRSSDHRPRPGDSE